MNDTTDELRAVVSSGLVRRGWREFQCHDCNHVWEWPSRDRFSPSGEDCPRCGSWCFPCANREDATLPCDNMGNLTVPWNWSPNVERIHGGAGQSKQPETPTPLDGASCSPSDYDAGLLSDYGGGDVNWWQDYLRAEIGRANDYWREIHDQQNALMVRLYNQGYHAGHEDTVEACFTPIHHTDMDTYHADVVAEILQENADGDGRREPAPPTH